MAAKTSVYDLNSYTKNQTKANNQKRDIYTDAEYNQMQKMLKEGREYSEMLRRADQTRERIERIRAKRERRKNKFADFLLYLLVAVFVNCGVFVVNHFVDKPSVPDNEYWSYIFIAMLIFGMIGMCIWGYISERIHMNERKSNKR